VRKKIKERFMSKWSALLLILALVLAGLWGCGGNGDNGDVENGTTAPTETPTATPTQPTKTTPAGPAVPTDTLKVAMKSVGLGDLMPWGSIFTFRSFINPAVDYLTYVDRETHELIPGLATKWEVSEDGMSCHFWLREGVQFHDGWGEMTAEDVKFSLEAAITTPSRSTAVDVKNMVGPVLDRIETPSPYEVVMYFKDPVASYAPHWMSSSKRVCVPIFSKAYVEEVGPDAANRKPIFTGPYKIVKYRLGQSIKLEAVEWTHWRVVPEYKYMEFLEVKEETTRVAMFKTGDVDIVEVSADTAVKLQSGRDGTIVPIEKAQRLNISLWGQWLPERETYDPDLPFLDKRVRQALNLAIDKEAIAEAIFAGYAEPIGIIPTTPWSDEFEPYPYDPDRARELLKEAGYGDGFSVELWLLPYGTQASEMKEVLLAVSGYWEAIGLDTSLVEQGIAALIKLPTRGMSGEVGGWTLGCPFEPWEQYMIDQFYSKSLGMCHYENPEMDALAEQTLAAPIDERNELTKQMMQHIYDEYAIIPLVWGDKLWVKGENVGNWETIKWQPMDLLLEYVQHPTPLNTFRLFEP